MKTNDTMKGRNVLITGAAKRIGKALVECFANECANVIVHYNSSQHEAEMLASKLNKYGMDCISEKADLSSTIQMEDMVTRISKSFGRIDILINNASVFSRSKLLEFDRDKLLETIKINAYAPLYLSRLLFGTNRSNGKNMPSIINLLDARLFDYDKNHVAYQMSKKLLFNLTQLLALELAPKVRVNGIAPGLIMAPEGEDDLYMERLKNTVPLQAIGTTDQICEAALFLAKNDYITGQVIYIDGGRHLASGPNCQIG